MMKLSTFTQKKQTEVFTTTQFFHKKDLILFIKSEINLTNVKKNTTYTLPIHYNIR